MNPKYPVENKQGEYPGPAYNRPEAVVVEPSHAQPGQGASDAPGSSGNNRFFEQIKSAGEKALIGAKEIGGKVIDEAKVLGDRVAATGITAKITDQAKEIGGKVADGAKEIGAKVADGAKELGGKVVVGVATGYDFVKEKVVSNDPVEGQNPEETPNGVPQTDERSGNKIVSFGIDMTKNLTGKILGLKDQIKDGFSKARSGLLAGPSAAINKYIRLKIEKMLINYLTSQPVKIKKALKDPDMCPCVQRRVDDLVDEFWPDVQNEILYQVRLKTNQPVLEDKGDPAVDACCCMVPYIRFKAWFLYTYDPVDASIWKSFKTFSWWLLLLIEIFPYYGVQAVFKLIYFLLMDKNDEFQLVQFILNFKKLQFFTLGFLSSVIGYAFYYYCATFQSSHGVDKLNTCAARGSADVIVYILELGGFVLQIVLVWWAYLLVPCSKKKGVPRFTIASEEVQAENDDARRETCCNFTTRGGRLGKFMCWEFFITLVSAAVFAVLFLILRNVNDFVSMRSSIFLVKCIYGLLSFPFIIFAIPQLTVLLSKTRETKYNKYGRCVPYLPTLYEAKKREEELLRKKAERKATREARRVMQATAIGVQSMMKQGVAEVIEDEDIDDLINDDGVNLFDEDLMSLLQPAGANSQADINLRVGGGIRPRGGEQ
jgi:hypothetical protein